MIHFQKTNGSCWNTSDDLVKASQAFSCAMKGRFTPQKGDDLSALKKRCMLFRKTSRPFLKRDAMLFFKRICPFPEEGIRHFFRFFRSVSNLVLKGLPKVFHFPRKGNKERTSFRIIIFVTFANYISDKNSISRNGKRK